MITILALAAAVVCRPYAVFEERVRDAHGTWVQLTSEQRAFVAGVFVMNPLTPPGLPLGDKAVLARVPSDESGLIFFIDEAMACNLMPVPKVVVDMLIEVGSGVARHAGEAQ